MLTYLIVNYLGISFESTQDFRPRRRLRKLLSQARFAAFSLRIEYFHSICFALFDTYATES